MKSEREKRLSDLLDAKELAIQKMLWQSDDNTYFAYIADEAAVAKGSAAVALIAKFVKAKFFLRAVLSDRITKANGQTYHPFWDDNELMRFQIGTSAYAEIVRLILAELKSWPANERALALMNVASRLSVDEAIIIYFAASTLPFVWDSIRNLIIDVGFLRWVPYAIALRFNDCWREGHVPPLDDRAFMAGRLSESHVSRGD